MGEIANTTSFILIREKKRDILEKIYCVNLKTRSRVRSAAVAGPGRK